MPTAEAQDRDALRARILSAFGSVRAPSLEEIAPHECDECRGLREELFGLVPSEIPVEVVERRYGDLPLLGPRALSYFLPGWLLFSLDHPDSEVFEYTIYHLTPGLGDLSDEYWRARLEPFTLEQREVVADFLAWAASVGSPYFLEGEFERGLKVWA